MKSSCDVTWAHADVTASLSLKPLVVLSYRHGKALTTSANLISSAKHNEIDDDEAITQPVFLMISYVK